MGRFFVWLMGLVIALNFIGCRPLIKTDLQDLHDNPGKYQGKDVIITTDLKSIVEDPESYLGRKIELKGYVTYNGFRGFGYWNFMLKDEDGKAVRCYEREYRISAWIIPTTAVKRADRNNEQLTVVGILQKGLKIELDWIEYGDQHIDTDYKPARAFFF